jgi:hypothetical protein
MLILTLIIILDVIGMGGGENTGDPADAAETG